MSNYTADQGQRSASTTSQADYRRSAMIYITQNEGRKETHVDARTHAHQGSIPQAGAGGLRVALSNPACLFQTESLCYTRQIHRAPLVLKADHNEE